ncbi:MAG: pyrroline-5-carboxylate reductase [Termitinemataceae bacterium]|nr:MAG: pyrroline-5-carboxylate reductase [Termitinemataceae bacterium]
MKLGFIGCGNMGAALLEGIVKNGAAAPANIIVFDRSERGRVRASAANVKIADGISAVVCESDMVILAVKPKDAIAAIKEARQFLEGKALLSIVAGLDYHAIKLALDGVNARVLVSLPNTPAMVGAGVTGFTLETTFNEAEKAEAQRLFCALGIVEWLSESMLYALSALSGSGPAYTAVFIEALADAAVAQGIKRDTAYKLAAATVMGTGKLVLETSQHPAALKDSVCSPSGTTIEGIKALERGSFRSTVIDAVDAAAKKFFLLVHP